MTTHSFIEEIKRAIPESTWPYVIAALRKDSLIWERLQFANGDFGQRVLAQASGRPEDYTPATLALISLEGPTSVEKLQSIPLQSVESSLRQRTVQTVGEGPPTLEQAGLKALDLRERRLDKGSWSSLTSELNQASPTVLACLYGMIPDPLEMLQTIIQSCDSTSSDVDSLTKSYTLAVHSLLSNPIPPERQAQILEKLAERLSPQQRLILLRLLVDQRPLLATSVAHQLSNPPDDQTNKPDTDPLDELDPLVCQAETFHISAQHADEVSILIKSLEVSRRIQARLSAKLARAATHNNDMSATLDAWEQASRIDPQSPYYLSSLILTLLDLDRLDDAESLIDAYPSDIPPHPLLLLAKARLSAYGQDYDLDSARKAAKQALELAISQPLDRTEHIDFLFSITNLLLDLNLPYEATRSVQFALQDQPDDPNLQALSAQALHTAGNPDDALNAIHVAVALAPDRLDLRYLLAESLEINGEWEAALEERSNILEQIENPSPSDLRAMATCALHSHQPEQAIQICKQMLHIQPEQDPSASEQHESDDGLTYALLGEATAAIRNNQTALEYLQRATDLAPQHAAPWTALSRIHKSAGQNKNALEALRIGTNSAPDQPEVHLILGEALLADDSPTQALAAFRRAGDLVGHRSQSDHHDPEYAARNGKSSSESKRDNVLIFRDLTMAYLKAQIAFRLGQTLHQLGHFTEARQVLGPAYHDAPSHPNMAFAYAQTLLSLDDLYTAIPPLELVIQSEPDDSTPYLAYARTLLTLAGKTDNNHRTNFQSQQDIRVELAVPMLNRALELTPDHTEAKILLAEALAASGDHHQARDQYRQLMETDLIRDPEWQTRISIGYGQVAMKLDQLEIAIAILKEADQADPDNRLVQQSLSEAYDALGLTEDAYQSAQDALFLAPNDLEAITWFANQVLELRTRPGAALHEAQSEAIAALGRAIRIDPDRTDLLVQLGQAQLQSGADQSAHNTFKMLLSSEGGGATDLHQAALCLMHLDDAPGAVICLERAIKTIQSKSGEQVLPKTRSYSSQLDLLTTLVNAHYQTGNLHATLRALDQAITIAPDVPILYLDKANILLELDPPPPESSDAEPKGIRPALACLNIALNLSPDDPTLLKYAVHIQRTAGDLPAALVCAEKMIVASTLAREIPLRPGQDCVQAPTDLSARTLAADLARALLQPERAVAILDHHQHLTKSAGSIKTTDQTDHMDHSDLLDYYFLRAELALDMGEDNAAASDMGLMVDLVPGHPRTLAIQSRLTTLRGNIEASSTNLQAAIQALFSSGSNPNTGTYQEIESSDESTNGFQRRVEAQYHLVNNQRAVAEAALGQGKWDTAIQLYREIVKAAPFEPLSHVSLARALILQAETQQLCQALEVVRHAPGDSALSEDAHQSCLMAIQAADQYLNPWENGQLPIHQAPITRWRARGQAVFEPSQQSADALATLPANPEDVAAHVACLNEIGDLTAAGVAARAYPRHAPILIRLALALSEEKPRQALAAAYASTEALLKPEAFHNPETSLISESDPILAHVQRNAWEPLPHALLARLVHQFGNIDGKYPPAQESIQKALEFWPDEPRWHILAAEIYLAQEYSTGQENITSAFTHLERAIDLEPERATPHLILGQIYFQNGNFEGAIKVLDRASKLAPDQPETWMILARAKRAIGDLEKAASHADRAAMAAPDQSAPIVLSGEIALEAGDPTKARTLAQSALRVQPDDPMALLLLARTFNALGNISGSLGILEKAIPLAQKPLPLLLERARLQKISIGPGAALETLKDLTKRHPDEPTVLALLAETLDEAGRSEESIRIAQRALHAGREHPDCREFEGHAGLHRLVGRQMRHTGQLDQAIHHLSEAIRLAPHTVEPYLELGDAHKDRRQYTQALNIYQQAISIAPDDPRAYYQAGLALKDCKDYMEAETMLQHAAELDPNNVGIHRLLGAVVALNIVHNRHRPPLNM